MKYYRLKFFRIPTKAHSPSFSPLPSLGYISQERSTSLWFRPPAPSHGPPATVLLPLFFQAKSLLLPKPCGKKAAPQSCMPPPQRCVVSKRDAKWLPCLGLNPSANLPLQPRFRCLPQLATAASIPGRCGPVVWSQLSPSSSGPHQIPVWGPPLVCTRLQYEHICSAPFIVVLEGY